MKIKLRLSTLESRENPSAVGSDVVLVVPPAGPVVVIAPPVAGDSSGVTGMMFGGDKTNIPDDTFDGIAKANKEALDEQIAEMYRLAGLPNPADNVAPVATPVVAPPGEFVGPPLPPSMIMGPNLPPIVMPPLLIPGTLGGPPVIFGQLPPFTVPAPPMNPTPGVPNGPIGY